MDTMRERFAAIVSRLLDEDPRLAVVLAEIGKDGFADAARAHPDRVINVGIREQLLVGVGGGLALTGMRPILHTFASFLIERPFEQIKLDFGHQGMGGVLVSAAGSYDWPAGGYTHMAPGDVALLDTLDGWTVHVPGHPDEAETLLRDAAAAGDDSVYVRLSAHANSAPRDIAPGRFLTVREGRGGVVIAVGPMLDNVLAAVEGLDVTVLYATTVRPFDERTLRAATAAGAGAGSGAARASAAGTGAGTGAAPASTGAGTGAAADVVIVEPYLAGTSTGAVNDTLADRPHRVLGLGIPRRELRRYGTIDEHLAGQGLDPASLRERIAGFLRR
ncbi:transketolase family protein [Streptomyces sp. RKCA744]|uniref:transketolase family protein n=1 Tax=Streptomyces sp. RKCA744 TaxID=2959340 RepID=UPI00209EE8C6|nr:transketolase [Streptomyces sp. RKCA744]MCO8307964.1 transketolase [Streptomyces sp. RKCA744]